MNEINLKEYAKIFDEIIKKFTHSNNNSKKLFDEFQEIIDELISRLSKDECLALFAVLASPIDFNKTGTYFTINMENFYMLMANIVKTFNFIDKKGINK